MYDLQYNLAYKVVDQAYFGGNVWIQETNPAVLVADFTVEMWFKWSSDTIANGTRGYQIVLEIARSDRGGTICGSVGDCRDLLEI